MGSSNLGRDVRSSMRPQMIVGQLESLSRKTTRFVFFEIWKFLVAKMELHILCCSITKMSRNGSVRKASYCSFDYPYKHMCTFVLNNNQATELNEFPRVYTNLVMLCLTQCYLLPVCITCQLLTFIPVRKVLQGLCHEIKKTLKGLCHEIEKN